MIRSSGSVIAALFCTGAIAAAGGGCKDGGGADVSAEVDGASPTPNDDAGLVVADAAAPRPAVDGGPSRLSPSFVHKDVNHVLATGQSLSVGAVGSPPLSNTQPYANLTFPTGVMSGAVGLTSFVPLVEGDVIAGTNVPVETMSSAFANLVTKMAREELLTGEPPGRTSHDLLVSVHGVGGTAYAGLKKGTIPYATGIAQAMAGRDVAAAANKSFVVRAVTTVHGESDHVAQNANYQADLLAWQADYEADVKALTNQTEPVPLFQTQMSSWTKYGQATSAIPAMQLGAHVAAPGKVILVGPKYHLPYAPDGVHLTNEGYRHMGEDYAKVYRHVVLEGRTWEPVRPKTVSRVGALVTIVFHVPVPPLVLDTAAVENPGAFGFEFKDEVASVGVTSVQVVAPDTVTLTLASVPKGQLGRVRYAFTGTATASAGSKTGPRGNLRDSDPTASRLGYFLYNWCIHFDAPVP